MTDTSLDDYYGQPVLEVGAEIRGLEGGLRDAVAVLPVEHKLGQKAYALIELDTEKHRHEPITKGNPTGALRRVHIYAAGTLTFVDRAQAIEHIEAQEKRVEQLRLAEFAEKKNITIEQAMFWQAHEAGEHDGADVGPCPLCEKERIEAGGDGTPDL